MITPEQREDMIREIAEHNADRLESALTEALDSGWLIWRKGKPRERRIAYMRNTLEPDLMMVLDPDYAKKWRMKQAPPLVAMQMLMARQTEGEQVDPLTSQPMQPMTPEPPKLWPIIVMGLPPYVFEKMSRDFGSLMREMAKDGLGS